jgi:hypothetical protein
MVDQKLIDAIKQSWDEGVNMDSIKQSLLQSGWSESDINKALEKVTGQQAAKKEEEKKEVIKPALNNRRVIFIAGGIILLLLIAVLAYFFLFKVGFSEDIPDDLVPLGKLNKFINWAKDKYNGLAVKSESPLKDAIQNGKINIILTNKLGTKIVDSIGLIVENGQIKNTALKVDNPSFDIKMTEKTFDEIITASDPKPLFLGGYAQGRIKIKSYGEENEGKLGQLNNFANYFFVF